MRNVITVGIVDTKPIPIYKHLEVGTLFRYRSPWNIENVYMKTNNPDYCLHLNTGILYIVSPDCEVVPLGFERITICSESSNDTCKSTQSPSRGCF